MPKIWILIPKEFNNKLNIPIFRDIIRSSDLLDKSNEFILSTSIGKDHLGISFSSKTHLTTKYLSDSDAVRECNVVFLINSDERCSELLGVAREMGKRIIKVET